MVTIMDMNTGKVLGEPEEYGEEVLNAGGLLQPAPSLQLAQAEHREHVEHHALKSIPPENIEAFLEAMYRYQE